MGGVNFSMV